MRGNLLKRFKCFSVLVVLLAFIFVLNYGLLFPSERPHDDESNSAASDEDETEPSGAAKSARPPAVTKPRRAASRSKLRTSSANVTESVSTSVTTSGRSTSVVTTTASTSVKTSVRTTTTRRGVENATVRDACVPAAWNTTLVVNRTIFAENDTNNTHGVVPSVHCSSVVRRYCLRPQAVTHVAPEMGGHITRLIHQSWKRPLLTRRFMGYALTWCECFPDWQYVLWTDEENEQLVREHYSWFYPKYKSFKQNIYRIDAIRYIYMHRFGGVYTDLDNLCLRNFEHLLAGRGILWGDMESPGRMNDHFRYVQNSFMYSRPGHPFWLELLRSINSLKPGENSRPEYATGPYKLMHVLADKWNEYLDMAVAPPEMFNPFSWWVKRDSPCKDLNNMTDEEMRACIEYYRARPASFVLQLHTQTWLHGKTL